MAHHARWPDHRDKASARRTVVLSGELDMAQVPGLEALLTTAVTESTGVYVDLSAVTFIDSTIISTLIVARQGAIAAGKTFAVVDPTGHVRHVLSVAGVLDTLLAETR